MSKLMCVSHILKQLEYLPSIIRYDVFPIEATRIPLAQVLAYFFGLIASTNKVPLVESKICEEEEIYE